MLKDGKDTYELYDLTADISESNNIKSEYPEQVQKLEEMRLAWDKELIDPIFLGLIHTDSWKNKMKKNKNKNKGKSKNKNKQKVK